MINAGPNELRFLRNRRVAIYAVAIPEKPSPTLMAFATHKVKIFVMNDSSFMV